MKTHVNWKITILKKFLLVYGLETTVYVRNVISFFYKPKIRWKSDIWNIFSDFFFLLLLFLPMFYHFFLKICYFWGSVMLYDVIVTSYFGCLHLFWYVWKEETHSYTMEIITNCILAYASYESLTHWYIISYCIIFLYFFLSCQFIHIL